MAKQLIIVGVLNSKECRCVWICGILFLEPSVPKYLCRESTLNPQGLLSFLQWTSALLWSVIQEWEPSLCPFNFFVNLLVILSQRLAVTILFSLLLWQINKGFVRYLFKCKEHYNLGKMACIPLFCHEGLDRVIKERLYARKTPKIIMLLVLL